MGSEFIPETNDHPALRYDTGDFSKHENFGSLLPAGGGHQRLTNHVTLGLFHDNTSAPDFTSDDFFYINGKLFAEDSNLYMVVNQENWDPIAVSQVNNTGLAAALDGFAKAFYALVLLDLGHPSPLTDGNHIKYLLSLREYELLGFDDATEAFDTFIGDMAPLGASAPARLSLQYVCSVPRQKDRFSMVVKVVVADIVLLSAFWTGLNWVATKVVSSRDRGWNHCVGCARNAERWEGGAASKTDEEFVQLVVPEKMV